MKRVIYFSFLVWVVWVCESASAQTTENVIQVGKPWNLEFEQTEPMGLRVLVNGVAVTNVVVGGLVIVSTNSTLKVIGFQVRNLPPVTEKGWHQVTAISVDALAGESEPSAVLQVRAKPNAPILTKAFP